MRVKQCLELVPNTEAARPLAEGRTQSLLPLSIPIQSNSITQNSMKHKKTLDKHVKTCLKQKKDTRKN